MICDLENIESIKNIIRTEGLNLLVVSYGGSCSNTLVDALEKNGYKCRTNIWNNILCHCPKYLELDIPIIYLYGNPIKSFLSMQTRGIGYWGVNQQKMSNDKNIFLSDENLIKCMINQFNNWTNIKKDNVLVIKASELFENNIVNKLEVFLKKPIRYFPIIYIRPKTNLANIKNVELTNLFEKYKSDLDKIYNFIN